MNAAIKTKPSILPRVRNAAPAFITSKAEKVILAAKGATPVNPEDEKVTIEKVDKTSTQELARLSKELDKIFNPENFKGLMRAPADLMLAASGRKIWDIPDKEITALAESGSICARHFVKTDPKWLALILFSMSLTTCYGGRAALHYREVQSEKKTKLKLDPKDAES